MEPLLFKKISIQKMPGFPRGIRTFERLAAHVNIIWGPNASGKSSTARLIQQMIWRDKTNTRAEAEGHFVVGSDHWIVKLAPGTTLMQKNGMDEVLGGLPGTEAAGRYMLALHELVIEDEEGLAKHIARESVGGYDLDLAGKNLDYSSTIKNKAAAEYKAYAESAKNLGEIKKEQLQLKKQEETLGKLRQTKEEALHAGRLREYYEVLRDYLQARNEAAGLKAEFEQYPRALEKINGEEFQRITDIEEEIRDAENALFNARGKIKISEHTRSVLGLPGNGIENSILHELQLRIEALKEFERDIREKDQQIAEAKARAQESLKSISEQADAADWRGIELGEVQKLDEFFHEAQLIHSKRQALTERIKSLENSLKSIPERNAEMLRDGIGLLRRWLKKENPDAGLPLWWPWTLSVLLLASGLATWQFGWPGLAGIPVLLALVIFGYQMKAGRATKGYESDYRQTGLSEPAEWNTKEVGRVLETLEAELESAIRREEMTSELERLLEKNNKNRESYRKLSERHAGWMEKLKLVPDLPTGNLENFSGMYYFLTRLKEWQQEHAKAEGFLASRNKCEEGARESLEKINAILGKYETGPARDAHDAAAFHRQLAEKAGQFMEALTTIEIQKKTILEKEEMRGKAMERLTGIYQKLGVAFGEKETVRQLVRQLDAFQELRERYGYACRKLADKQALLMEQPLHAGQGSGANARDLEETRQMIREYGKVYDGLEEADREITRIETLIEKARSGKNLETALTAKEEAITNMEALFEKNLSALTGHLIVDQLKKHTRDKNRPRVFHRASELFGQITRGRYELLLDDRQEAEFRAFDTLLDMGQELGELSTGTRIQLLLAVKLAFIETQEGMVQLPILADELLANSDETRAKAIIEALIEISRRGRQVFYFTAQSDEVAKWKALLQTHPGISHQVSALAGEQNEALDHFQDEKEGLSLEFLQKVPEPGELDHEAYGKLLKVPRFDPMEDHSGQAHLWYLLEDNRLLYRCLAMGIRYRGQLESFIKQNGQVPGLTKDILEETRQRARLLDRFCELYRRGRPRRINAVILAASGAVSPKFNQATNDLLQELNGNPVQLIGALKNKGIPGFRDAKIEELRDFLEQQGFIDEQQALSESEILVGMQAFLSTLTISPGEAENFINRVLA